MIATKKMIFAISTANPAMPPNPNTAAISATIRNVKAQPSMALLLVRRVSWRNYERRGMFQVPGRRGLYNVFIAAPSQALAIDDGHDQRRSAASAENLSEWSASGP